MTAGPDIAMTDVVWVCDGETSDCAGLAQAMVDGACLGLHRVRWREAYLAEGAHRMVCRFRAPDAESVRLALHLAGAGEGVWTATLVGSGGAEANLVLEREFPQPLRGDPRRALALARAECLEACGVEPLHVMISLDRRHAICLCHAPHDTAARLAGVEHLDGRWRCWPCRQVVRPGVEPSGQADAITPRT